MDRQIETNLGPIHANTTGSGPAVLLIHGNHPSNTWQVWEHNVEALAGAGFAVYALDLPGYGESARPHQGGGQMPACRVRRHSDHRQQAAALLDLMDAEALQAVVLGGVSWGGMIALELALSAPQRVKALILVDSAGAGFYAEDRLESIGCPVLVVWGEDDTVIPLANAAWFGAAIPNCRVEVIPEVTQQEGVPPWAGHHPMRFKPDEFNRIVVNFLQDIS
jgi:pimeloyl-ACP methyl ester carboxylesterase